MVTTWWSWTATCPGVHGDERVPAGIIASSRLILAAHLFYAHKSFLLVLFDLAARFDDYLPKPFAFDELAARLRASASAAA